MATEMILDGKCVPACFELSEVWTDALARNTTAIPLAIWMEQQEAGNSMSGVGVILEGDDDIQSLADRVDDLPFVALHLPKFTDGRVYSHAFRLRKVWNYTGTILIYGDVLRDQLLYMSRCGVNAFYMRDDQDLQASLAAFQLFSDYYQYN